MKRLRFQPWWGPRHSHSLVLALSLLSLPACAEAPIKTDTAEQTSRPDSTRAVTTACAIVESLRPPAERARCLVSSYRETPTEFVVKVREEAPRGARPPSLPRSEVRLNKAGTEATVIREPEL